VCSPLMSGTEIYHGEERLSGQPYSHLFIPPI
jgi:hypothetical protein